MKFSDFGHLPLVFDNKFAQKVYFPNTNLNWAHHKENIHIIRNALGYADPSAICLFYK
jgi:hypothetical protein